MLMVQNKELILIGAHTYQRQISSSQHHQGIPPGMVYQMSYFVFPLDEMEDLRWIAARQM